MKKILPIISILPATAVVIPMITSCSPKEEPDDPIPELQYSWTSGWTINDEGTLIHSNKYSPVVAQKQESEIVGDKIETYFNDIKINHQILADEIFFHHFNVLDWDYHLHDNSEGTTKLSIGNITVGAKDNYGYKLSFDLVRDDVYDWKRDDVLPVNVTSHSEYKVKNALVIFSYDNAWNLYCDNYTMLHQENDWEVETTFEEVYITQFPSGEDVETRSGHHIFTPEVGDVGSRWYDFLGYDSYYFANISK